MSREAIGTILLMAAATILTRLGGFWLMGKVRMSPLVKRWLEHLPGALVLAIVAPHVFSGDWPIAAASLAVVLTTLATGNMLLAMLAGSGALAVLRYFIS